MKKETLERVLASKLSNEMPSIGGLEAMACQQVDEAELRLNRKRMEIKHKVGEFNYRMSEMAKSILAHQAVEPSTAFALAEEFVLLQMEYENKTQDHINELMEKDYQ